MGFALLDVLGLVGGMCRVVGWEFRFRLGDVIFRQCED